MNWVPAFAGTPESHRSTATHSLPIFVQLAGRAVILIGANEAAAAKRRLLERAGARVVGEDEAAALAIVAVEEDAEAEAIVARLRARGILVNAVDRPALCDFTLPAIVDRDPVLIAIGTGGASAGLAKALRQRLEVLLPARLGALARGLREAREAIRRRWPAADARRRAIDAALEGPLDPFRELPEGAVSQWLAGAAAETPSGLVAIRLRSADPDDLSLREARMLGAADRLYHRPNVPRAVLDRARADAARLACAAPPDDVPPGLSIDLSWEPK